MKNDNLRKALAANQFYYAGMYEAMRPEHERIRIEQKQILSGVYREIAEMEARLRAIEEESGHKYTHYMPSYPSKDDDGGGDDSESDSGGADSNSNGNSLPDDSNSLPSNADGNSLGNYNPDEPRVPAGQPGGGQWTSGGSGQVMDDAGNLYPLDDSLSKPDGIPDDWMTNPANKGIGTKYTDPNNKGNEVRVMQGDPNSDFSVQQEPYVRWMNNGQWLDVNGNITTSKADAHIPLEDFEFMPGDISMSQVYKDNVIKYLPDLANYEYQKRGWAGKIQPDGMSLSFVEACCQLFDDTGLGDALAAGETVFGQTADQAIRDLSDAIDKVGFYKMPDSKIIDTPAMQNVREKAAKALQLILQNQRQ